MQYPSGPLKIHSSNPQSFSTFFGVIEKLRISGLEFHFTLGYRSHLLAQQVQHGLALGWIGLHVDHCLLAGGLCDWAPFGEHDLWLVHSFPPLVYKQMNDISDSQSHNSYS